MGVIAIPAEKTSGDAEVLEWIGTAYGRARATHKKAQAQTSPAFNVRHWTARRWIVTARAAIRRPHVPALTAVFAPFRRYGIVSIAVLVTAISALAFGQFANLAAPQPETATALSSDPVSIALPTVAPKISEDQTIDQKAQAEALRAGEDAKAKADAARANDEAKAHLAKEQEARNAAESRATQLAQELAAQSLQRENAERAFTKSSAELESERKARADAEQTAKSAKEALDRSANKSGSNSAAPTAAVFAPVTVTTPPPTVLAAAEPEKPLPQPAPQTVEARIAKTAVALPKFSGPAASVLTEGEKLFGKGDLEAARETFARAVKMGSAEGALALGNTFDPIALANAGLKGAGDPARARQWYRKAHELAQLQRQSGQP